MAIAQAAYSFAVLVIVLWYTLMVWRMTDGYFRDEYKKHLKTSATEISGKTVAPKEDVVPKEFKEDPPWMVARRKELEKQVKTANQRTDEPTLSNAVIEREDSFVSHLEHEENVCYSINGHSDNELNPEKCD